MSCWVFQIDSNFYRVDDALRSGSVHTWLVNQYRKDIHVGDKVFIYRNGDNAAILARGVVQHEPEDAPPDPDEEKFLVNPLKFSGKRCRVRVKTERFAVPLSKNTMLKDPVLSTWFLLAGMEGTNFKVSRETESALEGLLAKPRTRTGIFTVTGQGS
jgi:EVE domain-containing protein